MPQTRPTSVVLMAKMLRQFDRFASVVKRNSRSFDEASDADHLRPGR
jgi:hypothetical protein